MMNTQIQTINNGRYLKIIFNNLTQTVKLNLYKLKNVTNAPKEKRIIYNRIS